MRTFAIAALAGSFALAGCDKVDLPFLPKSDAQLILGAWSCTTDQGRGVTGLALNFGKDGKGLFNMKGDTDQGVLSMGVDIDIDLSYSLAGKTLAMKATGGKVNKLTVNGQTMDLAAMGGADAVQKKMVEDMKMGDSTIAALDAQQLVLKPKDGGTITCKRPA